MHAIEHPHLPRVGLMALGAVVLAIAVPTPTLPPFSSLCLGLRVLARAMRAVL